jgi:hypothetical protein
MNIITKKSALYLAIFSVLAFNGAISALAGTVSGGVVSTNILIQNNSAVITIGSSAASAANDQTGRVAVSGQVDNKSQSGWKLTVASSNIGKLVSGCCGTTGTTYFATRLSLGESAVG